MVASVKLGVHLGVGTKIRISILIPAYNEEKNIGKLLSALLKQRTNKVVIGDIVVVSSGSTDKTEAIVEGFSKKDSRIILIREKCREGKPSAINESLKVVRNSILVLESADTIPSEDAIERLCLPFIDEKVGMTGARPIPVNDNHKFTGYLAHLLWELHHYIALKSPKCGELIAFRRVFQSVPRDMVVDEAWIEYEITRRGYKVVYVPEAVVYNKGPGTVKDFLKQRRRIAYGHVDLHNRTEYKVSSWSAPLLLSTIQNVFAYAAPKKWAWLFAALTLEGIGRCLGYYDYYIRKKKPVLWEIAQTTKSVKKREDG